MDNELYLDDKIVKIIVDLKDEEISKRDLGKKYPNKVLRGDLLEILDNDCVVIYFPIENERNNGFHRKMHSSRGVIHFVFINTNMTNDRQVFTAAHELGHLWGIDSSVIDRMTKAKIAFEDSNDLRESIINRFAAELLMPEFEFRNSFEAYNQEINDSKSSIRLIDLLSIIVHLMDRFLAPFKSVLLRLSEVQILDSITQRKIMEKYETQGEIYNLVSELIKKYGYVELIQPTGKRYIKNLDVMLKKAENGKLINEDKINRFSELFEIDLSADDSSDLLKEDLFELSNLE